MKNHMQNKPNIIYKKLNEYKAVRVLETLTQLITGLLSVMILFILCGWVAYIVFDLFGIGSRYILDFISLVLIGLLGTILVRKIINTYKEKYKSLSIRIIGYTSLIIIHMGTIALFLAFNISLLYFILISLILVLIIISEKYFIEIYHSFFQILAAEEIESRVGFNGELVSAVDFMRNNYNHDKNLETMFIDKVKEKVRLINPIKTFRIPNIKSRLLVIFIPIIIIITGELLFPYKPSSFINSITNPQMKMTPHYVLYYNDEVLFGKEFSLFTETNADDIDIKVNYGGLVYDYSPNKHDEFSYEEMNKIYYKVESVKERPEGNIQGMKEEDDHLKFNAYSFTMPNIDSDFTFKVIYTLNNNKDMIEEQRVKVIYLPEIINISYTLKYPEQYMMKDYKLSGDGNIQAFVGSKVKIEIKTNNPMNTARLVFIDKETNLKSTYDMEIHGAERLNASFDMHIDEGGAYSIELVDIRGNQNQVRSIYTIQILDDAPPYIEMTEPKENLTTKAINKVGVIAYMQDDILIKRLDVIYDIYNEGEKRKSGSIPLKVAQDRIVNYNSSINFKKTGIQRGESLNFRLRVMDSNKQTGFSKTISITYPDEYDVMESIKQLQEQEKERLDHLLIEQKKLKEEIDNLKNTTSDDTKKPDTKKLEELIKRQEELIKEINKTQENLNQIKKMSEEDDISSELNDKINELNRLLNEMNRNKADDTLNQLKNLLSNEENQASQSNAPISEEEYIKRLEKAIEKMKNMIDLSLIVEAGKIADDLIKLQEDINKQIDKKNKADEHMLDELNKKSKEIDSILNELSTEEMVLKAKPMREKLEEINSETMQDFSEKAQSTQKRDEALSIGEELKHSFEGIKKNISQIIEKMQSQDYMEILNYLEATIKEFIDLSNYLGNIYDRSVELEEKLKYIKQEELSQLIEEILFIRATIINRGVEFDKLFEGVMDFDSKSVLVIEFTRIGKFLYDSADEVNHKRFFSSIRMLDYASNNLSKLTMTLIKLKIQIKNNSNAQQQGGGGKTENYPQPSPSGSMDELAEAQKQLTETVKNFVGKKQGGELSEKEKEYLEKLAEEQRAIGERFGKKFGNRVSKEKQDILEQIEQVEEEIEDIAMDIESYKNENSITERQSKVLERMIKAEEGIQSEEYQKERKAQQALDRVLDKGKQKDLSDKLKELLSKQDIDKLINDQNIAPEYVQYIIDYFKGIREQN